MPIISVNFPVQASANSWFDGLFTHVWRACDPCVGLLSGGLVFRRACGRRANVRTPTRQTGLNRYRQATATPQIIYTTCPESLWNIILSNVVCNVDTIGHWTLDSFIHCICRAKQTIIIPWLIIEAWWQATLYMWVWQTTGEQLHTFLNTTPSHYKEPTTLPCHYTRPTSPLPKPCLSTNSTSYIAGWHVYNFLGKTVHPALIVRPRQGRRCLITSSQCLSVNTAISATVRRTGT